MFMKFSRVFAITLLSISSLQIAHAESKGKVLVLLSDKTELQLSNGSEEVFTRIGAKNVAQV